MTTIEAGELRPDPLLANLEQTNNGEEEIGSRAAVGALLLFPAGLTVVLSFNAGAFFPGTTALAALIVIAAAACCLVIARRPFEGVSALGLSTAGAMALFAAWTLLSSHWSHAPGRALLSYDRVLIYLLTFATFASLRRTHGRMRMLLYGIAGGCVVVCLGALISRTLPHVLTPDRSYDPSRLAYPLTYWNTLGLLAGVGLIFCGHLACSAREPWAARVLGAAAAPLLATTLFLTYSRGAAWATLIGVIAYLAIARPPSALLAGLATLPPWALAVITLNPPSLLVAHPYAPATITRGKEDALVLLGCAVTGGALRAALLPLDARLARFQLSRHAKRGIAVAVVLICGIGLIGVVGSGLASRTLKEKVSQFQRGNISAGGLNRLFSASSNGRVEIWRVAVHTFSASPQRGTGAGTFAIDWNQERRTSTTVINAHSLYLETLAELGWVGMLLLGAVLLAILIGVARLARGPGRALYAALFGASIAWVLAATVDWDWQMPAVTVWLFAVGGLALAAPAPGRVRLSRLRKWMRVPALAACAVLALAPISVVQAERHVDVAVAAADAADCQTAVSQAARADDYVSSLPQPAIVTAYCAVVRHHPASAVGPLRAAIAQDPSNWQLWYDLAVVRIKAGQPAASEMSMAEHLNPLDGDVQKAVQAEASLTPAAARHVRALARLRAQKLREQNALAALQSRTRRQDALLRTLRAQTAQLNGVLGNLRRARRDAPSLVNPIAP